MSAVVPLTLVLGAVVWLVLRWLQRWRAPKSLSASAPLLLDSVYAAWLRRQLARHPAVPGQVHVLARVPLAEGREAPFVGTAPLPDGCLCLEDVPVATRVAFIRATSEALAPDMLALGAAECEQCGEPATRLDLTPRAHVVGERQFIAVLPCAPLCAQPRCANSYRRQKVELMQALRELQASPDGA